MPRNRFREIMRHLRFDDKETRELRLFFYNLLDLAAINAHVQYKTCFEKTISRRDFIMDLAFELRENYKNAKTATKKAAKEARYARP
ncbi:hypothetical protein DPEC_G00018730 [Dallia pectoralis]|uniref:Uncharacterized protein n=1 Tax=Dallia pectoralis TaxID=75939 RepID=A0ACC2HFE2_DALPE|nr:hypothetical protein DPEC_G00018730 [Dallia pectoralis]